MKPEDKERFIQWQDYRITQFSFAINLFLGFGVASLAFSINQKLGGTSRIEPLLLNTTILYWAISCSFGCFATVSRLLDFRYTVEKIRMQKKCNTFMAKVCGPISWGCFWAQLISYIAGASILIWTVIDA